MSATTTLVLGTFATKCACCGRTLTDALSQEAGMGPTCRKSYGFDNIDGVTSWAHAFTALGAECPADVYEVVRAARSFHDDADGAEGARKIANYLVKRLALSRSGVIAAASTDLRVRFIKALSALGFRTLAARIAKNGLGQEIANVTRATGKVTILRNGKEHRVLAAHYENVDATIAACEMVYAVVLVDGVVHCAAPTAGDWFVDANTGVSVRAAFAGEERAGLLKVDAWEYFARSVGASEAA